MITQKDTKGTRTFIWITRLVRWGMGIAIIWAGGGFEGAWPALVFGGALIITGFFRPRGCLGESCNIR
ncbi:hypothetical protein [Chitinophaga japonensis]|uniref:DUF2892 domain-containing protein n=1 Tax=Chitinophaga japonensis TaxID=104662 RepID=A0A562T846_CHIJA|nr:hypothetical protein [Chitinophaga japonensis]TWI89040.1 hypothetical protein LX66_3133 [Chitinophaga japonensis]